jgi:hypothetical protein
MQPRDAATEIDGSTRIGMLVVMRVRMRMIMRVGMRSIMRRSAVAAAE